jgi:tetratricopeptide (TPR) repeat protein
MNFDYCFMKWVSRVFIFVMLLVTACSSVQKSSESSTADVAATQGEHLTSEVPLSELPPTDSDVMYHVFSAEALGAEGDFSRAASEYLEAALISDDPDIAERAARIAVSAGEWQMVALASDRWAMLDPVSLDARELAAGSRLREGDYVGAEYQLAKILELTADNQSHGWRIVTMLLAPVNDQVRATKVMDNLLKDFDAESSVGALTARSQLAARNGDLDQATELINKAILLEPENSELLAWAGRLAVNLGYDTLALKRYKQAWLSNPDNPQIAMAYADLLKRNNDVSAAQSVLAQLPDTPEMRFARIVFALDAGDRQGAEDLYRGFSKAQYADTSDIAFQAAQSAELLTYHREAIDWYEQVTGERSLRAIMRQAFLLAGLGDVEEARNLLKQLRIQTDKGIKSQSYQAEAQILQDASREDEAMQILNDALADLPEEFPLRYARALLAVELDQLELAESDLRQIISAHPGNAAAINALGYTLADRTDRFEEAELLILQAYELQPEDASIIDSMGWISYRLGRLKEAEGYLREAWRSMRNADVAAHLGEVLWAQGQKDEARSLWELGLEMGDDRGVLAETMQRLGDTP